MKIHFQEESRTGCGTTAPGTKEPAGRAGVARPPQDSLFSEACLTRGHCCTASSGTWTSLAAPGWEGAGREEQRKRGRDTRLTGTQGLLKSHLTFIEKKGAPVQPVQRVWTECTGYCAEQKAHIRDSRKFRGETKRSLGEKG